MLTEHIRNTIKSERKKRKISGIKLSEKLGKSPGYVSHLEKGVIKKIERKELENLFKHILNINNNELENYINNLLQMQKNDDEDFDDELGQLSLFDFSLNDRYFKVMQSLNDILGKIYLRNKEETLQLLNNFNINLKLFGIGFMLNLCGLPFFEIGNISAEEKKEMFNEIVAVFQKYLKKQ